MFKSCRRVAALSWLAICALLMLQSCREKNESTGTSAEKPAKQSGQPAADSAPPRSMLILYTGDSMSAPEPDRSVSPPEGGLPAMTNALMTLENELVEKARARVTAAGGDPSSVKPRRPAGFFGEEPYMLLDYGGWERPDDNFGTMFVQLFFKYAAAMNYTNLAAMRFETLSLERWNDYQHLDGYPNFLASTAHRLVPGIGPLRIRELDYLGAHWGIVSIPELTAADAKDPEGKAWKANIEEAAGYVKEKSCAASVLIAPGLPAAAYEALKSDHRFTVVIGVPAGLAAANGSGSLSRTGPLMLPRLLPGGRQLGYCRLIAPADSNLPAEYEFELRTVVDDETKDYPYRKQCNEQIAKHAEWSKKGL